ncbi:hypothetical protein A9K75_08605 [Campylobacter fetus subsp. testudinum]|uniref:hypothetical protein n=1 Tax=Campylobacter fetus TaxID=196 RepID=UPI0008188E08|nr:hypothetical protein [Campylobacter fetus]OCR99062.1 hypothetical protein A9K75_08605 [Campylobacter fetus subsp. testudinum]
MNAELEEIKGLTHGFLIPTWIFLFSTGFLAIYWLMFVSALYARNVVGSNISKNIFLEASIYTWSFFIIWTAWFGL